ncbi:MAG: hypothetical protein QNJ72_43185 [Pleurocapsa sp. MO_226.B13]|nr:hypothetical protein [Pleurocapsa sp. MO_226.B13]
MCCLTLSAIATQHLREAVGVGLLAVDVETHRSREKDGTELVLIVGQKKCDRVKGRSRIDRVRFLRAIA